MKILNISLEKKLFSENSGSRQRVLDYSKMFERFDLVVLTGRGFKELEFGNMSIVPTNSLNRLCYLLGAYSAGRKLIKKYKHDIISAQDPFEIGFMAWLLARKNGLKLQIQIHGDYFSSSCWRKENFANSARYYLGKCIVKKADTVRVVSERIKRSLIKMGLSANKIKVVPVYTPVSGTSLPVKNKANGKFIFLTVGRLVPVKNISMQIQVINEVVKICPESELWIAGDGPEMKKLASESRKLGTGDYVKFLGWKDNLEEFYKKADAFLLTSNYEGWGMAIIEAASFGLPIIMTDVGCAGEIIKNGESGIVINVGDKKALIDAMTKLIKDDNFRKSIGEYAKKATLSLPNREQNLDLFKESFNI